MRNQQVAVAGDKERGSETTAQFLSFFLAEEEYGIDILMVQEIRGWGQVTPIPNTPPYIKGVMNLRGTIVPIVDLRIRFNMEKVEYGPTTVVIVLKLDSDTGQRTVGIVVDAVSEVYDLNASELQPPPDFGATVSTEFMRGLATVDKKMVILLDIGGLISTSVLDAVEESV